VVRRAELEALLWEGGKVVGVGTGGARDANGGDDVGAVDDSAFEARWAAVLAALEGDPAAELLEALRTVKTPVAVRVGFWLMGVLRGDQSRSVPVLLRQYRRHLERTARPKRERPETRNEHVYEFERGKGEVVRATVAEFRGKRQLHLRTWFRGRDGAMRCTKRGIAIAPELLPELEAAVRALREAVERIDAQAGSSSESG